MNALLERVSIDERTAVVNQYLPHAINTWTLPGGVQASGEDDQRRLSAFLKAHPLIEQALAQRIANAPWTTPPAAPQHQSILPAILPHESAISIEPLPQAQASALPSPRPTEGTRGAIEDDRQRRGHHDPLDWPKQPTRLSSARAKYMARYQKLNRQNDRTQIDKDRILDQFEEFLQRHHADLGPDPWVHAIDSSHVSAFLEEQADRPGKRVLNDGEQSKAAPTTMLKKLSDMSHFFTYQRTIAKATKEDIAGDLADEAETWKQQASEAAVHYQPFTSPHIKLIFDPVTFLGFNRDPDYFFAPLLGLHLGLRLGDFVRTKVVDIGHLKEIDVWYIDVTPEDAKNANSVRRLPITEGLIRAGFLDYVEHVRKLGAIYLFPHRDWSTATAKSKPSKNQSAHFGKYMDSIDLSDPMLVFHSFRHTVISAMQDAGVPLAHAMQIAGHEAMDHAVRTNQITKEQARSVHLSVYTHADLARLGVDYPILKLKDALERSIKAPIDYARLAKAGSIVVEHLKKFGGEFRAGWAPQKARYTEAMTKRIFEQARP